MSAAGRPPKPFSLHAITGSEKPPEPEVKFETLTEAPECPEWINNPMARHEFDRMAAILVANRLLTDANINSLASLCLVFGRIVFDEEQNKSPNATLLQAYRQYMNDFGLLPCSQMRAKPMPHRSTGFAKNKRA